MHGVGIISLGFVMDAAVERRREHGSVGQEDFEEDLHELKGACHWTSGTWRFGKGVTRKWNELQNTSGDIQLVADYLLHQYRTRVIRANGSLVTRR